MLYSVYMQDLRMYLFWVFFQHYPIPLYDCMALAGGLPNTWREAALKPSVPSDPSWSEATHTPYPEPGIRPVTSAQSHTEETKIQQLVYFPPQSFVQKKSLLSQEINCIYGAELLLKKRQHFSSDILLGLYVPGWGAEHSDPHSGLPASPGWFRAARDLRKMLPTCYLHDCSQSRQPTFGRVGWLVLQLKWC